MELARFEHDVINRWQKIYGARPAGLIDQQVLDRHPEHRPPPAQVQAVVACTARDVLLSLRANGVPERLNVQLIPTKEPFTATQQATVERLREHPELPLLLLHDASPQGCLLHQTIRQSLQLRAYHTVVDVGLHPSDAISQNMMRLGAPPPKPVLEILKQRVGMDRKELARTAGLAARPLSQAEFKWLEDGYYTPILYVPPARLIKVLVRTLQRLNLATPATSGKAALPADPDPEEEPQRAAEQVGFMSWPTA
jgi:hypothetical protein